MRVQTLEGTVDDSTAPDLLDVADWIVESHCLGPKAMQLSHVGIIDTPSLDASVAELRSALVEVRLGTGVHEIYQLPFVSDPGEECQILRAGSSTGSLWTEEGSALNLYNRIEVGVHPEPETLEFLGRCGFRQAPALHSSVECQVRARNVTLGVVHEPIPERCSGRELVMAGHDGNSKLLSERLWALGATVATMHNALGSVTDDRVFAPEGLGRDSLALRAATLEDQFEGLVPHLVADEGFEAFVNRGGRLRDRIWALTDIDDCGMAIRLHGNLRVGKTVHSGKDWMIVDFAGDQARPLLERRRKHSPLRDLATLVDSVACTLMEGRRGALMDRAREDLLDGYMEVIDPRLLPATQDQIARLLAFYELESAIQRLCQSVAGNKGST